MFQKLIEYMELNSHVFWNTVFQHIKLTAFSIGTAIIICVPLGIYISKKTRIANVVINIANIGRVVPSLAFMALAMPFLGVGLIPAYVALTILACPPILINTYVAIKELNRSVIEAAYGMGMSTMQVIRKVEFPLAIPVIFSGIRTASVETIASAMLAVLIGGGGLGNYIMNGIAMYNTMFLLLGAIPIAILTATSEIFFGLLLKRFKHLSSELQQSSPGGR